MSDIEKILPRLFSRTEAALGLCCSVDVSAVENLRNSFGAESTIVSELIKMFSKSAPEKVDAILNSLETKNWPTIEREAHSLKSNAKTLGANRLGLLCEDLENHKDLSVAKIESLCNELKSESKKAISELQGLLKT